jgi:hypothetical protein
MSAGTATGTEKRKERVIKQLSRWDAAFPAPPAQLQRLTTFSHVPR